jgi:ABC-2 type transport system ATP-binding protein
VINKGEIILVEKKAELMRKLGKKQLTLLLDVPIEAVPSDLARYDLVLSPRGSELTYTYDSKGWHSEIPSLLADLGRAGIKFHDLNTAESSLEDIFVSLVRPQ